MKEIIENYNINVKHIEKLNKGYATNKWIITTNNKKYILKEENISKERLEFILYVVNNLKKLSPSIIKTKNSDLFVESNNKFYYLMQFINSKEIQNLDDKKLFFEIGKVLATLHKELKKLNEKQDSFIDYNDNTKILEQYLKDAKEEKYIEYIKIIEYKLSIINEINKTNINLKELENQVIHGDFYLDNILYNDKFIIIDFDQTCTFYKEYEVLRAMMMICMRDNRKETLNNMKIFIKGYLSDNQINSPKDAYNLYLYIQANSLSSLKKEHYNILTKREFAFKRFNILKFLYEEKDEIIKILENK